MFGPPRTLGVPEPLIDVFEPFFRVLVELGYDRSIPAWEPTPARLIPRINLVKLATYLVYAIGEGINNALALVGLPPLLKLPAPVKHAAPTIAAVEAEGTETGLSDRVMSSLPSPSEHVTPTEAVTRADRPAETEQLGSMEPATECGPESTDTAPPTSEVAESTGADELPAEAYELPSGEDELPVGEDDVSTGHPAAGVPTAPEVADSTSEPTAEPAEGPWSVGDSSGGDAGDSD